MSYTVVIDNQGYRPGEEPRGFLNVPSFQNFQISKFQNFKKYSEIRGATSISDAFILSK